MPILALGISFPRAPIELLERLAFTDDDLAKASRRVGDLEGLEEAVVLSTCNRVEVYGSVASYHAGFLALKRLLAETRGIDPDELAGPLYAHWEQQAAEHLFAVAAGLDSLVLGETQIHAQVREALRRAEAEGTAGPALTALFHAAGRAGRRVRQETSLGAAPDALVALAATLAEAALGRLAGRQVVVVGAGQIAGLAVKHLRARNVGPVRILNRSLEHARALAARTDSEAGELHTLARALVSADLVVSATGAAGLVVHRDEVARAIAARPSRPLVLVDLAVPRDVDPEVASVDGVRVIDIVALRDRIVADREEGAADDLARARRIVDEEVRRWVLRRRGDELAPLIRSIRRRGDEVVRAELERHAARLAGLTPDERQAVEALARGIAAKLLHDPIVGLKERSEPGADRLYARLLAELLGIDPDAP
ncbi:MAG: glutamyl-tRNA reductase [Actinomycetota bacterium]|jgi:glutamyl-tRNA reductase|nr:MAG: glutamyl-tRNA reductase [Actinomycetota bacterium]